ncbi:hypothetical protein [Streptomyces sp. NPDC053726]|uniref:hypothetical protein n=1 Tax=Streptomyces sp. NPDC053726 TaxID=3365713 RepID=UPI0037D533BB
MTAVDTIDGGGAWLLPVAFTAAADVGRVLTPAGYEIDADTARRVELATPANTRRGRESRARLFLDWCREHGRAPYDPGTVPDYCAHLARLHHPAETIAAYASTLANLLAVNGRPLGEQDRYLIQGVLDSRALEIATDPHDPGDALQSTECTRADLRKMVRTLDRSTDRGRRDAFALLLDWYMGGRSCEPGAVGVLDVREEVATVPDPDGGPAVELPALEIVIRRSKTNVHGRRRDIVRLVAQSSADADLCPVRAYREWMGVLDAHGIAHTGPLLRRIDRWGRIGGTGTCAGRQPDDARQAAGLGARTIRNLIRTCAKAAGLVRELTTTERELLSTTAERAELAAAESDEQRAEIRTSRRIRRRALRRRLPRYTGHSMRRGLVRHLERMGMPRHVIERACRFVPGSKALARYGIDLLPWADNPTVHMRTVLRD